MPKRAAAHTDQMSAAQVARPPQTAAPVASSAPASADPERDALQKRVKALEVEVRCGSAMPEQAHRGSQGAQRDVAPTLRACALADAPCCCCFVHEHPPAPLQHARNSQVDCSCATPQVLSLQKKLDALHATDVNDLRRAYTTLRQHVQALDIESKVRWATVRPPAAKHSPPTRNRPLQNVSRGHQSFACGCLFHVPAAHSYLGIGLWHRGDHASVRCTRGRDSGLSDRLCVGGGQDTQMDAGPGEC